MNPTPPGVDMNAIEQALHSHILNGGQAPQAPQPAPMPQSGTPAPQGPPGGQMPVKSGPGFDSHTKVLSKALIHKLLTVV